MKRVCSNYSEVCHLWAHHSQDYAESGNVHFRDARLFSYGTCIGERFEINGNVVFVCNDYAFSKSTGRHQNAMRNAIPDKDPNVHVFHVNYNGYGDGSVTSSWHGRCRDKETEGYLKIDLIRFASLWLARLWNQCLDVKDNNKADIGVDLGLFDTFKRYYRVTGVMTMKKLMRMTDKELSRCFFIKEFNGLSFLRDNDIRKVRKFIRLLDDNNSTLETIVDFVAGKGEYAAYINRTGHLHLNAKLRRMSEAIGFKLPGQAFWRGGNWRLGQIKTAEYKSRKADVTLISWMLEQKRLNMHEKYGRIEHDEYCNRKNEAKRRLELYLGFAGWSNHYCHYHWGRKKHYTKSFNYDGEVFSFKECPYLEERSLSEGDYIAYTKMSKDEQKAFVHEKRLWMLNDLKGQKSHHEAFEAEMKEQRRIREEERKRGDEFRIEVKRLKCDHEYGILRDYWRKGVVSDATIQNLGPSFFYGGNVLLRVTDKYIKSSKGICVTIAEAVRMWKIVKRWHNDESTFEAYSEKFFTTLSNYGISRYQNDILIAGCHAISYVEMERAAIELGIEKKEEKTAVAVTA